MKRRAAIAALFVAPTIAFASHRGVLSSRGVAPPRDVPASVTDCGAPGIRCDAAHASAACVEGRCLLVCDEGFADCDAHAGDGCEVELATDPHHCGRCDRSCGGAACEGGHCAARLLGHGAPIAADDEAVYAHRGGLVKLPLDGADEIALTQDDGREVVSAIAVDATLVYWALPKRRTVLSIPRAGGEPTVVVEGVDTAAIAVAAGALFWLEPDPAGGGVVKRMPVSGGQVVVAAHTARTAPALLTARPSDLALLRGAPDAIAADAASLYWATPTGDGSAILRVPVHGGAASGPTRLVERPPAEPSQGGAPAPVTSHPSRIHALTVNTTHVFWSDARARIFMAPKPR